ncbi:MAG: WecB/TagA/CpsF family glycosyltransferase [Dehalococcoidia bacterium]
MTATTVEPRPPRVRLFGMPVDALSPTAVEARLDVLAGDGRHHQVVTVNTDFVAVARRDAGFHALVCDADLVVPDGAPVLWAARLRGHRLPARITGPDIITMAVRHSVEHGSALYFLGGAPGVASRAAERLRLRWGAFTIAGISAPSAGLDAAADASLARQVRDAAPDFVFVGFGCPKQDFWIRRHRDLLPAVCVGVGGSFNYLSGDIRRAPSWAQRSGLEWAFRLATEPRRLARRYLLDDLPVAFALGWEALRHHVASPHGQSRRRA